MKGIEYNVKNRKQKIVIDNKRIISEYDDYINRLELARIKKEIIDKQLLDEDVTELKKQYKNLYNKIMLNRNR